MTGLAREGLPRAYRRPRFIRKDGGGLSGAHHKIDHDVEALQGVFADLFLEAYDKAIRCMAIRKVGSSTATHMRRHSVKQDARVSPL
jgi:hypothetical protein